MQTFLPYPNFEASLRCLDDKRLGKQRVEAFQILKAITQGPFVNYILEDGKKVNKYGPVDKMSAYRKTPWYNHPATQMWIGYTDALQIYYNLSIGIWRQRGFINNMAESTNIAQKDWKYPHWFNDEEFHDSHKSKLLQKDPEWYGQFDWDVPYDLEYKWPVAKSATSEQPEQEIKHEHNPTETEENQK